MTATSTNTQAVSLTQIQDHGVVGAGGAGFPTHVKLKSTAEFVILNAAECEPLLHKDKELLRAFPDLIIAGLSAAGKLVGAKQAIVGIKGKYHDVIDMLRPKLPGNMKIVELSDSYPAGDEFILVHDTTGRIIAPGKIPLTVGCVVINVETALNIARNKPVTSKFLTIAGAVKHPVTVEVPIGVTFAQAISLAGGPTCEKPALLVGGAMMGKYSNDFNQPITKTTGGLIVLPANHKLVLRYTLDWPSISRIGASCCDQCSFCTSFCPRYLLGHPVEPHKAMRSLGYNLVGEANILGSMYCCECNLCTMMACPEDLDPKNVMSHNKRKLAAEGKKWDAPPTYPDRAEMSLNDRRVPIPRLITKLGLSEFTNKGPLQSHTLQVSKVTLPLRQHVGAPAKPVVAVGDKVTVGQVIARPDANALGAFLHASIQGTVTQLEPNIVIEA